VNQPAVTQRDGSERAVPRVLVVEDDEDMLYVLRHNLESESLAVLTARDGEAGLAVARANRPDLIVLDVMLPRLDGFRVLRALRVEGHDVPVLLLTARSSEPEKVYGFRAGADDYVTKPFGLQELLARIEALLRRSAKWRERATDAPSLVRFGDVEVHVDGRVVRRAGREVGLSPRAFELLLALYRRRDGVAARQDLMREVWGYADGATSRTLDAHVPELRRKLEGRGVGPRYIETVWRVGYRLRV
jgi:DNA-binding response OmpR family regulator